MMCKRDVIIAEFKNKKAKADLVIDTVFRQLRGEPINGFTRGAIEAKKLAVLTALYSDVQVIDAAKKAGMSVVPHGKYGYCISK